MPECLVCHEDAGSIPFVWDCFHIFCITRAVQHCLACNGQPKRPVCRTRPWTNELNIQNHEAAIATGTALQTIRAQRPRGWTSRQPRRPEAPSLSPICCDSLAQWSPSQLCGSGPFRGEWNCLPCGRNFEVDSVAVQQLGRRSSLPPARPCTALTLGSQSTSTRR